MTEPKKFKFMWGQRQSAMITEAMIEQITVALDDDGKKEIDSEVKETFFVSIDGIFSHYMPEASIKDLEKNGQRYNSEEYATNVFQGIDKHVRDFFSFAETVTEAHLATFSDEELNKIFGKYRDFITKTFHYFATSTPEGTAYVVEQIKKILSKKALNEKVARDYFIMLSTPSEMDETMRERIDFMKIAKNKNTTDKDLRQYAYTYPALFFNTYSGESVMQFLRDRCQQQRKGKLSVVEEEKRMNKNLTVVRENQEKIYSEMGSELKRYAHILHQAGLGRYRLKHIWSGGEYACLHLIQEVAKRVGGGFDDFIKTYRFSDIIHFLKTGTVLPEKEVKARKKCFALHYYDKTVHFLIGEEAIAKKASLLPPERKNKETKGGTEVIKGIIASTGVVKGRARVVFVEDLEQFVKDSAAFQHGEILVTTMTSPVMIPLIAKAAAIVTDEGGITSHAAISAREFKIPCVVGTHGASATIRTGDEIEVNANKGLICIKRK